MTRAWVALLCTGLAACAGDALPTGTSAQGPAATPHDFEPATLSRDDRDEVVQIDSAPVCRVGGTNQYVLPSIDVDAEGRALVAWRHCDGTKMLVAASSFDGARWTSVRLGGGPDGRVRVSLGTGGRGLAVWHNAVSSRDPGGAAYYHVFDVHGGWSARHLFAPGLDALSYQFHRFGGLFPFAGRSLVWSNFNAPGSHLQASHVLDETRWTTERTVHLGEESSSAALMGDAQGNVTAVWIRDAFGRKGRPALWSARFDAHDGWSSARAFHTVAGSHASTLGTGMNAAGEGYAAWEKRSDDGSYTLEVARYSRRVGWRPPIAVEPVGRGFSVPWVRAVDVDPGGTAHVVWRNVGTSTLWTVRLVDGGPVGPPERLGEGDQTRLATRADGAALALWSDIASDRVLFISRFYPGRGWDPAETVPLIAGEVDDDETSGVALDERGHAFVLWVEANGDRRDLWVRRFRL